MSRIKIIILGCFIFGWGNTDLCAQSNTVASGGDATGSGGQVSYSIGQIDYGIQTGGSYAILEGIQQPQEMQGVLPIQLLNFTAWLSNGTVQLNWITAMELNNDHFDLERSSDGIRFVEFAVVKSQGNSNIKQAYQCIDPSPLIGYSYYRLKQIDIDGNYTYSGIRIIENQIDKSAITLYPNPVQKSLNLRVYTEKAMDYTLLILDMNGKTVGRKAVHYNEGTNLFHWNVESLPAGVYILKTGTGNSMQIRFFK